MTETGSGSRQYRGRLLAALVLCSLVVVGSTALTGVAAAEEEVTDCTVVDVPGTYVLENDVSTDQTGDGATCIEIVSSDVVFDGNGHAVVAGDPVEFSNYGIHVTGVLNVTVRNVSTTGWDELGYGIKVDTSTDVLLSDLGAENNTFGAAVDDVDSVELDDVAISRSDRAGLQILKSSSVLVRDSVLSENAGVDGWSGIDVRDASTTNVAFDNVTVEDTRTGGHGIDVSSSGSNVTVANSTMVDNSGTGLLVESDGVSVTDTETTGNRWSVTAGDGASVAVADLDVGESTAPGTALNLSARNVRLRANASPPSNPAAQGIGRYFEVESLDNASLDVAVHYEAADVEDVDEDTLHLRRFDGSQWVEVSDSTVDTGAMTVTASPSELPQSERSTFGVFGEARVASFEVEPVNETIVQGEPLEVTLTNVTDAEGDAFSGSEQFNVYGPNGSSAGIVKTIENGESASPFTLLDGAETENLETGEYEGLEVVRYDTESDGEPVNDTYDVSVVASPVASFDVTPVNGTIVQGEPVELEFTNVTYVRGGPYSSTVHEAVQFAFEKVDGSTGNLAGHPIEDGTSESPVVTLDGSETTNLDPGVHTGSFSLYEDESITDSYEVEVVSSPVASFEVEPVNDTIVQGEPVELEFTNVTHVRGGPYSSTVHEAVQFAFEKVDGSTGNLGGHPIEDGTSETPVVTLDGPETTNLDPGVHTGSFSLYEDESITDSYEVEVVSSPVASFEVEPVNDTIVQGEPLEVTLTNVTHVRGGAFSGIESFTFHGPNRSAGTELVLIEDGEQASPFTLLEGAETENLETGEYEGLESWAFHTYSDEERVNDTYDVSVVSSPVGSFEVSPVNDTIAQGEPLDVLLTNVTHVRGGAFSGIESFTFHGPNRSAGTELVLIEDGEQASPFTLLEGAETENLEPGEYEGLESWAFHTYSDEERVNDTYDVSVRATTFEVESEFAGVVHDDTGLEIAASWLPVRNGEATLSIAGRTISDSVTIENRNVSTTVDLTQHLDPGTETGPATVVLAVDGETVFEDGAHLVHEAYDLDEGYSRWSIPQPAALHVTEEVADVTRWNTGESTYDDVGFSVNDGETITDGENLHGGLYVNAESAEERIGFDFVTPGEEGLPPGGAEPIEPGWNLLGSNYDVSSGNQTLNLDLNTVSNLPATAADYEGDEGMVAHDPQSFVRIGGDDVVDPYDTYWVYVDVGEDGEIRAIVTAEYGPAGRVAILDDEDE